MSRWVIIAGLATILISLVALASLSAGSNRPTTEEAARESAQPEGSTEPEEPAVLGGGSEGVPEPPEAPREDTPARDEGEERPVRGITPEDRRVRGPAPRIATVEVTGDASYSCSVGRIDSPRTVRGANPAVYQVRVAPGGSSLDTVMAVCQKITGDELDVGIVYDGEVRARGDTTERFGTVSVSWSPMQQD